MHLTPQIFFFKKNSRTNCKLDELSEEHPGWARHSLKFSFTSARNTTTPTAPQKLRSTVSFHPISGQFMPYLKPRHLSWHQQYPPVLPTGLTSSTWGSQHLSGKLNPPTKRSRPANYISIPPPISPQATRSRIRSRIHLKASCTVPSRSMGSSTSTKIGTSLKSLVSSLKENSPAYASSAVSRNWTPGDGGVGAWSIVNIGSSASDYNILMLRGNVPWMYTLYGGTRIWALNHSKKGV
jgi:hypothetical protein